MIIRAALESDIDALLDIHNAAILETTAIWTDEPALRSDREAWFSAQAAAGHPILIADIDGIVAGYASYAPWRAKFGYRYSVENSVYVASGYQGQGIGRALMVALIDHARAAGMHLMVADIEAGNVGSVRLHETLGFEQTGLVTEVGTKFGRWLDPAIMQLKLS